MEECGGKDGGAGVDLVNAVCCASKHCFRSVVSPLLSLVTRKCILCVSVYRVVAMMRV